MARLPPTPSKTLLLLGLLAATAAAQAGQPAAAEEPQPPQQRLRAGAPTFGMDPSPVAAQAAQAAQAPAPTATAPKAGPAAGAGAGAGGNGTAATAPKPKPMPKQETPQFPPPSNLYHQQRVEYTFPEPVALAAAKLGNDGSWTKAYAAFPCLNCFVTDAGCYYEYKQDRNTQIAFLTGAQYKALLAACPKAQEATKACWDAAGLQSVPLEAYGYRTYAYHDKAPAAATPDGTYLVLNNDPSGPAEIEYGMAYFGLDPNAPSFPGGLVVGGAGDAGDPRAPTRLKEIVQGLSKPVTLAKQEAGIKAGKARPPADPAQEGGGVPAALPPSLPAPPSGMATAPGSNGNGKAVEAAAAAKDDAAAAAGGWTRRALAMGNTYANNGFNWWANAGAEYTGGGGGGALQGVFLSGEQYRKLTDACPETENGGVLVLTAECWAKAGLDRNPATQPQSLPSGGRLTRKYDGAADPNQGGTCVDGWWVFINASDGDVTVTKADANFGLRTLGNNPRDAPPRD